MQLTCRVQFRVVTISFGLASILHFFFLFLLSFTPFLITKLKKYTLETVVYSSLKISLKITFIDVLLLDIN